MHLLDSRGGRIELARRSKGLSPGEFRQLLSEKKGIEIGGSHWARVESNKAGMSLSLLEAICELLEESADWILFGKAKENGESDVGVSEKASEVASIVDAVDEEWRDYILHIARQAKRRDEELRNKDQTIAALRSENARLKSAGRSSRN